MIGHTTSDTDQAAPQETPPSLPPDTVEQPTLTPEHGGREGPDPTRYGDWEKNGRCIDF